MCKYNHFIHLASSTLVRGDKVFESKEATWIQNNWIIFEKGSAEKNCHLSVSDMMKSYIPYCLYWHQSKKFMPTKWNADEGYCLEILSLGLKNKLPFSMLPSLFFELVIIYPWKCWNRRTLHRNSWLMLRRIWNPVKYLRWNFLA